MTMTEGEEAGKLFVGGLSWETSKENLQRYFSRYGEVVDSVVMKNSETGRSRGFGFVTFKDSSCVSMVLSAGPHELDGRTIDPKACTPRSLQRKSLPDIKTGTDSTFKDWNRVSKGKKADAYPKIFLGGLPANITETEIRSAFSKYGKVIDVVIMYDQEKKRSRGFGFLSFESEDSIEQACAEHFVTINGKQIECKRAEPRDMSRRFRSQQSGPPADNQWASGGMGMGGHSQGWGSTPVGPAVPGGAPGAPPSSVGNPMANGMMAGGYQPGWGAPQQQAPYAPQSAWPSQAPGGAYPGGYQGWGAAPAGFGAYGGAPSAQYSQPAYPGYGAPGSFGYTPVPGAPPSSVPPAQGVAGDAGAAQGAQQPPTTQPPTTQPPVQTTNPYGTMGSYSQENSSFGPSRGYGGGLDTSQAYMGGQGFGSAPAGGYAGQGDGNQANRNQSQAQGYHPYRR